MIASKVSSTTPLSSSVANKHSSNHKDVTLSSSSSSSVLPMFFRILRWLLLQLPLYTLLCVGCCVYGAHHLYHGPLTQLLESFRLSTYERDDFGLYVARDPEITYYNRQCRFVPPSGKNDDEWESDISTHDANDLLIESHMTSSKRREIMMTHGAIVQQHILSRNTSTELRQYLEKRHDFYRSTKKLPWNELFWDGGDGNRLSLGIGPEDHPVIARALTEVAQNNQLKATLEAILGPNPAVVEVSTLTTMHGATHQDIHTDSDYFGSSVLYARSFLHSYTMFIALQDTTAKMGATTICPGTHFCANEDLEDLCMGPQYDPQLRLEYGSNSFEASSNGQTGIHTGMLMQGDAMMFNQNVWHRGPRNRDPERPYNRVMFILTFVSQRPPEDVRQQGWGTYYYMRHSMWGQTFEDLKHISTADRGVFGLFTYLKRLMKAYGLSMSTRMGQRNLPWLEHWARQQANEMDFFTSYELQEFKDMLKTSSIPKVLWGNPTTNQWGAYLSEMMQNARRLINQWYLWTLLTYIAVHAIGYAVLTRVLRRTSPPSAPSLCPTRDIAHFVWNTLLGHGVVLCVAWSIVWYVSHQTPLFRRIATGEIHRPPFPLLPADVDIADLLQGRITAFPERMDILIGSRFDAEYLASMNDMLDYHPGNKHWNRIVEEISGFPLLSLASHVLVNEVTSTSRPWKGVPRRFLLQDHVTGYWTVMSTSEAVEEARRALWMANNPWIKTASAHWKQVLADARFGLHRDTAMGKIWIPKTVNAWMTILFGHVESVMTPWTRNPSPTTITKPTTTTKSTTTSSRMTKPRRNVIGALPWSWTRMIPPPSKNQSFRAFIQEMQSSVLVLKEGDTVLLIKSEYEQGDEQEEEEEDDMDDDNRIDVPYMAKIIKILGPDRLIVHPMDEYLAVSDVSMDDILPYRPIQQEDDVILESSSSSSKGTTTTGIVRLVHPFGTADVEDDQGMIFTVDLRALLPVEDAVGNVRLDWLI